MPNMINVAIEREYASLLDSETDLLFVQPVGMAVADSNAFREKLSEANLSMHLLKASLARRVLESHGLSGFDEIFSGPAAVIVPVDEADADAPAVTAAKVVGAWRKATGSELPAIKGGVMEGAVLDVNGASALQKLPGKTELRSMLVGQILGPGRRLAAQLIAPAGKIAGAIETHIDNQEKAG